MMDRRRLLSVTVCGRMVEMAVAEVCRVLGIIARRLGAPGLDEGPRSSPTLAPAPGPCYDVNGSPPPRA